MKIKGPQNAWSSRKAKPKDGARLGAVGAGGPARRPDGSIIAEGSVSVSLLWDEREERSMIVDLSADEAEALARRLWAVAPMARGAALRGSELDGSRNWREVGAELRRALEIYSGRPGEIEALLHLRAVLFKAVEEALDAADEEERVAGYPVHADTREGLLGFLERDPDVGEEPDPE